MTPAIIAPPGSGITQAQLDEMLITLCARNLDTQYTKTLEQYDGIRVALNHFPRDESARVLTWLADARHETEAFLQQVLQLERLSEALTIAIQAQTEHRNNADNLPF